LRDATREWEELQTMTCYFYRKGVGRKLRPEPVFEGVNKGGRQAIKGFKV